MPSNPLDYTEIPKDGALAIFKTKVVCMELDSTVVNNVISMVGQSEEACRYSNPS
jgi:hypothetical protein